MRSNRSYIRQSLQVQPKNIKKLSKHQINQPNKKKPNKSMGASRRSLQAQPNILKKLSEHQIYQPRRKFSKKKYA
jgi:hypothetical protein